MERLVNQLGNMVTVICGLSCACIVMLVFGGGFLLRTAGVGLFSMIGDLIVGRVDQTPANRTQAALPRPTSSAAIRTRAQSLDFDTAVRQQGGAPVPMTIQGQSAAFPAQAQSLGFPGQTPALNPGYPQQTQGYANTGYNAQAAGYGPTLQDVPPMTAPGLPALGNIQPLQDNRLLGPQEMRAQAAPLPNQPYPAAPYQPLGGSPVVPSLSGQAPISPGYQSLGGSYQQQAAPGGVDPNAFFPPPSGGIPRRASLSGPRDVSANTMGMDDFNVESYPGLRNRRSGSGRRGAAQDVHDSMAGNDSGEREGGLGGVIGDLGNLLGL